MQSREQVDIMVDSKTKAGPSKYGKGDSNSLIIQGYTVVALNTAGFRKLIPSPQVIQVKGNSKSRAAHSLYLKQHSSPVTTPEWPQDRTLLVYNVPAYCKEKNLELVFRDCGQIQRVYMQPKPASVPVKIRQFLQSPPPNTYKVAYVVFKNEQSLKKACSLPYDHVLLFSDKETRLQAGLGAYIEDYEKSIIDISDVESRAEMYLANYYAQKDEEEKQEKEMDGVPDEDGFIKVTRHGKNKGGRRTEETERKGHEHIRKRKKKNELKDFYTFQFRETKRQQIADLQSKFEEDKRRVQQMKMARKFKPY